MRSPDRFLDDYLPYLFTTAHTLVTAEFDRTIGGVEVSTGMWRALCHLADAGRHSVGSLAHAASMPQPSMSRAVDRLVELGWVDRQMAVSDRRSVTLELLPAGHDAWVELSDRARSAERQALANLDPVEVQTLRSLMRRAVSQMQRDGSGDPERTVA
jgi:MarR family transcriptional regulator, organic hydroperoxide resistance regulator